MPERLLGPIVRIQVQRNPLKAKGTGFDPGPILAVDEAVIGPPGLVGRYDGVWVVDAHHAHHPQSRAGGRRPLSIGFTHHYGLMADRFGTAPLGCAGENLIVDTAARVTGEDLSGTVVVRTAGGDIVLGAARVAAPCREFTSFLLGRDDVAPREEIAADLEFLDEGTRGYVLDLSGLDRAAVLRLGDEVFVTS